MSDDFLTAKEACKILKCNLVTLWRYVKDGKIKKHVITRKNVRYSKNEIQAYIRSVVA
ncbi:helix-turn-helix domain-containing protein [Campylobacter sp. RM9344]|uniref:Helix-turn-helix domain-containing protein n=1 Tax=Campylobacter californiensis TaxID=1032243 RepID=A0AAW3ZXM8_9BACT|nr:MULTISPECIES: helix-turn-helix domain-containing protein [unclassified Campylobacter]MBE2985314.1 helix-turn-helix domain-containing protein [Campylobacter sp. RM6883]MBE2995847.1 helix-turn-helix domain-containing protein [Campylobacter sp. RM6913]MBE3030310.1 helix-turn-helix domain-containing protein [Campylobacter sp. RM9344]MBE3608729.1 helix-turn-helix domain-containing protein [Campylobacter sp. RM9337]